MTLNLTRCVWSRWCLQARSKAPSISSSNGDALNQQMLQRFEAANEMGLVLRHVARFDANGKARVGVEAVRPEHPLASLLPCDNVFAIESRWYRDNPLVIRGPGAGRDVTAGAIQSDLNRLAQLL